MSTIGPSNRLTLSGFSKIHTCIKSVSSSYTTEERIRYPCQDVKYQNVKDKVQALRKQLKNGKSDKVIWERSEEIAKSKVRLTLGELLAKVNIKTSLVDEIENSEQRKSKRSLFVLLMVMIRPRIWMTMSLMRMIRH